MPKKKMANIIGKVMRAHRPTLLVWGFNQHGKSSFIDSAMRYMYDEDENLVRRAGSRAPDMYSVLHVLEVDESNKNEDSESNKDDSDQYKYDFSKDVLFRLVDSPAVASEEESKTELLRVLKQGVCHKMRMGEEERHGKSRRQRLRPECVILVVSCMGCNMSHLRALADIIHGTCTPFVVAVTHKDKTTNMHLGNYLMQVADACRNESVFCFENYVQRPDDSEIKDVEQNDQTNCVMSKLIKQAMHYIWEDILNDRLYNNESCCEEETHDATVDDKKEGSHNPSHEANVRRSQESFEFL